MRCRAEQRGGSGLPISIPRARGGTGAPNSFNEPRSPENEHESTSVESGVAKRTERAAIVHFDERGHFVTSIKYGTLLDGLQALTKQAAPTERWVGERFEDVRSVGGHSDDGSRYGANGFRGRPGIAAHLPIDENPIALRVLSGRDKLRREVEFRIRRGSLDLLSRKESSGARLDESNWLVHARQKGAAAETSKRSEQEQPESTRQPVLPSHARRNSQHALDVPSPHQRISHRRWVQSVHPMFFPGRAGSAAGMFA